MNTELKINLTIDGTELTITMEQANELYTELSKIFRNFSPVSRPKPIGPLNTPLRDTVTAKDTTISKGGFDPFVRNGIDE